MDFSKNYYKTLGVDNSATIEKIKKSYYKLSFQYHPDKGGDPDIFSKISEAYSILSNTESKSKYDKRSKFGSEYDEVYEFLDYEGDFTKVWDDDKLENFKKNAILNIVVHIDDSFNGSIEYERWVSCKKCKGSGKDLDSKIEIRNSNGKIIKIFEGSDGCDYCEGTGKDYYGNTCYFCAGEGKIGAKDCNVCKGEKRILGKQKLSKIIFPKGQKAYKIESMGHVAKDSSGKCGHLWLIKDNFKED